MTFTITEFVAVRTNGSLCDGCHRYVRVVTDILQADDEGVGEEVAVLCAECLTRVADRMRDIAHDLPTLRAVTDNEIDLAMFAAAMSILGWGIIEDHTLRARHAAYERTRARMGLRPLSEEPPELTALLARYRHDPEK